VEFKLLGPVQAQPDGGGRDLLAGLRPQHRLLLTILLMAKGNRVSMAQLADSLWDDTPPYGNPQGDLNGLASDLRRALAAGEPGRERIPRGNDGYRVIAEADEIDALRFQELACRAKAQAGHDDDEAVRLGRRALREWGPRMQGLHGPSALDGLRGRWADDRRQHLGREYRNVLIRVLEAEFRRGNQEQLAADLALLEVDGIEHGDEDFARIYMLACQQQGHRFDAADFYRRFGHAAQRKNMHISGELSGLATRIGNGDSSAYLSDTITGKTISLHPGELAMTERKPSAEEESASQESQREDDETAAGTEAGPASSEPPPDPGLIQNFGIVIAPGGQFGFNR
jgi:DNA-binding SARP family transcriptional activator